MYTQYKCMYNIQLTLYLNIERKQNIKAALTQDFYNYNGPNDCV